MERRPIHIVDTLAVDPADQIALLTLVRDEGIPVMTRAGLELVACRSTLADLGEEVLIQLTWQVADHEAWNQLRKNFVTDPGWWAYAAKASQLWHGGTRRFFYPTPIEMVA